MRQKLYALGIAIAPALFGLSAHAQTLPDSLSVTTVTDLADTYITANVAQATAYSGFFTSIGWVLLAILAVMALIAFIIGIPMLIISKLRGGR